MRISRVFLRLACCLLGALLSRSYATPAPLITDFLVGDGPAQARVGESTLFAATGLASPVKVFFHGSQGPVEATDLAADVDRGVVVVRVPAGATTGDMTVRANNVDSPGFYFRVEPGTFVQGSDVLSGQVRIGGCAALETGCADQSSFGGIGIPGALVALLGGGQCGSNVFQDFATTDETGHYTMHGIDGNYVVLVFVPVTAGLANVGIPTTLSSTPAVLDFDLPPGTLVTGKVVDAVTSAPIPNARVSSDLDSKVFAHEEALSDVNGDFHMRLLTGDWEVAIAPPPGNAHASRRDNVSVSGATQDLDKVSLFGGVLISGTASSAFDDTPLSGARIRAEAATTCCSNSIETGVAGDGTYLLVLPPNQNYLVGAEMGNRSTLQDIQIPNLVVETDNQTINLVASGAAIITGTVTDLATEAPIACLRVNAQGQPPVTLGVPQGGFVSTATAPDGTYRLRVPPAPAGYIVATGEPDDDSDGPEYAAKTWNNTEDGTYFPCEGVAVPASVVGGTASGIDFALPLGVTIQGQVSDQNGSLGEVPSCTHDLSSTYPVNIDDGTSHGCSLGWGDYTFPGPGYRISLLPPSSVVPALRACVFPPPGTDDPQCYNLKTPPAHDPIVIAPGGEGTGIDFCLQGCQDQTWYQDLDHDGFGNPFVTDQSCLQPEGYVAQSGDCDDSSSAVHPGAQELCNGVDDNCNSQSDEGGVVICDDGNPCTSDACGGGAGCGHTPQNEGSPCSDGNACTQTDTCQSGSCVGANPVVCNAPDQCHNPGTCAPATGQCGTSPAKANGTPCNDSDACTQTDTCQAGSCSGGNPVVCNASDQCHDPGTCAPATGLCGASPAKANGSPCNDTNACTQTDTCQSGSCSGGNPVVCNASNQCHDPGTCVPATGLCSASPAKANGTPCNDTNACTQTDTCQSGSCSGGNPVVCNASDQCHSPGTCAPATGLCGASPAKANGSPCNDTNACTQTDTCQSGSCSGGNPVVCNASDQCHSPGTCAPATGLCSASPAKANGSPCNDTNACTQTDTCQAGSCTGSNPVTCNASDQCHDVGTCAPATGQCSNPEKVNGAACDDTDACTQTDTCQSGSCTGANPVVCAASDQCHDPGTCAPDTGLCSASTQKANGTACDDEDGCTGSDVCQAGVCAGAALLTPRIVTFSLNHGAPTTYERAGSLNFNATGDALEYIASENSAFAGAEWQPYSATLPFTLSAGPGRKAVFVKLRACSSRESRPLTDRINLIVPRVLTLALDQGAATTTAHDVTLSITSAGNPTEYLASEDRFFTNATWQPLSGSPTLTLGAGTGRKTVYLKVRNEVGESLVKRDTIKIVASP